MIARRLVIRGRVQGVWFRDWTVKAATALKLTGWVRNRADGSVEALAIGSAPAVERFVETCREGPPDAHVSLVEESEAECEPLAGFERRRDA